MIKFDVSVMGTERELGGNLDCLGFWGGLGQCGGALKWFEFFDLEI